jgi:hypothetical protein
VVPALRDVTTLDRVWPLGGDDDGVPTVKYDALGQAGLEVPR